MRRNGPDVSRQVGLLWVVAIFVASGARADDSQASGAPSAQQCISFHVDGQSLRMRGRFAEASERLRQCLHPECSPVLRADCASLLDAVERETPSVVLAAVADGADLVDVTVREGDRLITERLDGRPLPFDPGPHELLFEAQGRAPRKQVIVVRAGVKNRLVSVTLGKPARVSPGAFAARVPDPESRGLPPRKQVEAQPSRPTFFARLDRWDYALASVGIALAGVGAGFGVRGLKERNDVTVPERDVRRKLIVADVLLGASTLTLGALGARFAVRKRARSLDAEVSMGPRFIAGKVQF